jgi:hypothetical protein
MILDYLIGIPYFVSLELHDLIQESFSNANALFIELRAIFMINH